MKLSARSVSLQTNKVRNFANMKQNAKPLIAELDFSTHFLNSFVNIYSPRDNKWKHRCKDQVGESKPEWTKKKANQCSTENLFPCMVLQIDSATEQKWCIINP